MSDPVIEMRNITKKFPGVLANDHVNLSLYPGEVHALLGENGAGKSTLMNVLTGIYKPDEGQMYFCGEHFNLKNPKVAVDLGIGMVHQHFHLLEPLTVTENLLLGAKKKKVFLNFKTAAEKVKACSDKYGMFVEPTAKIWQLSVGEQQRVEILKLLFHGAEILILDEPTAVLTPQEAEELFNNLHKMAAEGKSVVFITHKLNEVMNFADRITVLRDGKSAATMLRSETNKEALTKIMVGRELEPEINCEEKFFEESECLLNIEGINVYNDRKLLALKNVDLKIHAGEILCIAGVAGNGQRELSESIAGLRKISKGKITVNGQDVTNNSPKELIRKGVAFIPEDRIGVGLISNMDMMGNLILKNYDKAENSKYGILNKKKIKEDAKEIADLYEIKSTGIGKPVKLMSGGNQQKLLVAREISDVPSLIVAVYPVRGVDIGATEAIHRILLEQRRNGAAILLISEDLDEIFSLADTIAVLHNGEINGVIKKCDATYEQIGWLMLGEKAKSEGA